MKESKEKKEESKEKERVEKKKQGEEKQGGEGTGQEEVKEGKEGKRMGKGDQGQKQGQGQEEGQGKMKGGISMARGSNGVMRDLEFWGEVVQGSGKLLGVWVRRLGEGMAMAMGRNWMRMRRKSLNCLIFCSYCGCSLILMIFDLFCDETYFFCCRSFCFLKHPCLFFCFYFYP